MDEHPEALSIVKTLKNHGYTAYYAGGWVRDFLLNLPSDDIDIATDAPIEEVQKIFSKTIPVGVQFGIVIVVIAKRQYEVATFRKDLEYEDGRRPSKIEFTSAEEDAKRRDFTINGMFFDPIEKKVIDFVGGQKDLDRRIIEAIGNPHERIKEDRLRMIRAIRMACRFHFTIAEKTEKAIRAHIKELFPAVAIERIWQELSKMAKYRTIKSSFSLLFDYGLLQEIFPTLPIDNRKKLEDKLAHVDQSIIPIPLIGAVLLLFERTDHAKWIEICQFLKLSRQEQKFATLLHSAYPFLEKEELASNWQWAHFYADRLSKDVLYTFATQISDKARQSYLNKHEERKLFLRAHIFRIENNAPLVSAELLINEGIKPGKQMGKLLLESEKIAINENLEDPRETLSLLKKTEYWGL